MLSTVLFFCLASTCFSLESNFYREESCARAQGYCVLEQECPQAVSTKFKRLCAGQINQGAVCCKNFPVDQVNCYQLHNECRKTRDCPDFLNIGQKGCTSGTTCCALG